MEKEIIHFEHNGNVWQFIIQVEGREDVVGAVDGQVSEDLARELAYTATDIRVSEIDGDEEAYSEALEQHNQLAMQAKEENNA